MARLSPSRVGLRSRCGARCEWSSRSMANSESIGALAYAVTSRIAASRRTPARWRCTTRCTRSTSLSRYQRCPLAARIGTGKPCLASQVRSTAGVSPVRAASSPIERLRCGRLRLARITSG